MATKRAKSPTIRELTQFIKDNYDEKTRKKILDHAEKKTGTTEKKRAYLKKKVAEFNEKEKESPPPKKTSKKKEEPPPKKEKKRDDSPSPPPKKEKKEKKSDSPPPKKTSKKAKDDDGSPKKPKSAYFLFCDAQREKAKGKKPTAVELGKQWRELSDKEKGKYEAKRKKLVEEYQAQKGSPPDSPPPKKPSTKKGSTKAAKKDSAESPKGNSGDPTGRTACKKMKIAEFKEYAASKGHDPSRYTRNELCDILFPDKKTSKKKAPPKEEKKRARSESRASSESRSRSGSRSASPKPNKKRAASESPRGSESDLEFNDQEGCKKKTQNALKEIARGFGLPVSGNKSVLCDRILAHAKSATKKPKPASGSGSKPKSGSKKAKSESKNKPKEKPKSRSQEELVIDLYGDESVPSDAEESGPSDAEESDHTSEKLSRKTVNELKAICREKGYGPYSALKKAELVDLIVNKKSPAKKTPKAGSSGKKAGKGKGTSATKQRSLEKKAKEKSREEEEEEEEEEENNEEEEEDEVVHEVDLGQSDSESPSETPSESPPSSPELLPSISSPPKLPPSIPSPSKARKLPSFSLRLGNQPLAVVAPPGGKSEYASVRDVTPMEDDRPHHERYPLSKLATPRPDIKESGMDISALSKQTQDCMNDGECGKGNHCFIEENGERGICLPKNEYEKREAELRKRREEEKKKRRKSVSSDRKEPPKTKSDKKKSSPQKPQKEILPAEINDVLTRVLKNEPVPGIENVQKGILICLGLLPNDKS